MLGTGRNRDTLARMFDEDRKQIEQDKEDRMPWPKAAIIIGVLSIVSWSIIGTIAMFFIR